jgi:hypothetical protein
MSPGENSDRARRAAPLGWAGGKWARDVAMVVGELELVAGQAALAPQARRWLWTCRWQLAAGTVRARPDEAATWGRVAVCGMGML